MHNAFVFTKNINKICLIFVIGFFLMISVNKLCIANPNLPPVNGTSGVSPIQGTKNSNNNTNIDDAYKDFANRNNKEYQKQKAQQNKEQEANKKVSLVVHYRPEQMPPFPDGKQEYKSLFDDEFTNFIDKNYLLPDDKDIFISQNTLHRYNKIYKHGNDNTINQIDVIEAEKSTQIDSNDLDEYEIGTHRTRVVAFLTQDQMLLSDMFDSQPDAYYIDMVKAKLDKNLKYKK